MRRFTAFAIAGALALAAVPAVASAGSAAVSRYIAPPFVQAGVVFVPPPIPVPRVEVVTAYPGHGFIWVPGYWSWGGRGYHWVHGGWHRPPHYGYHWVPPYWSQGHGGHRWVDGQWRHRDLGWSHRGYWGQHRRFDGHRSHGWQGRDWRGHR